MAAGESRALTAMQAGAWGCLVLDTTETFCPICGENCDGNLHLKGQWQRAILSEISITSASLDRAAVNNTYWELQEYKKKWSKGHAGCWAPGVDGGLRFPGHQDGLESFIASPYRPRSKTARIYFLPGEMQKSKVQRQLTQSHLKKINLLKVSISLKSWREAFFFRKKNLFHQKSATFV